VFNVFLNRNKEFFVKFYFPFQIDFAMIISVDVHQLMKIRIYKANNRETGKKGLIR